MQKTREALACGLRWGMANSNDHARPHKPLFDLEPPDANTHDFAVLSQVLGAVALITIGIALFFLGIFG